MLGCVLQSEHAPRSLPEAEMTSVQLIRAIVRRESILTALEIEARTADAVRNAPHENSLERGVAQIRIQIRQREDQLAHHAAHGKRQPPQNAAEREHLRLQSAGHAERD